MLEITITTGAALAISALLTGVARSLALSHGLLDVPNERSSHNAPTPRGGGVAIVLAFVVASCALALLGWVPVDLFWALTGGGLAVAVVGFLDDRYHMPAGIRLAIHVAAALWALAWLGGSPSLIIGEHLVQLGWAGYVLGALSIVWALNFFNFMDGIDGIAASEAAFIASGGALLGFLAGDAGGVSPAALVLGAACCGFLLWNWPPAKIFMGDVGSGYLGYVIGVLALAASHQRPADIWVWLILSGAFFVDATVTLVRRLGRGERVYQAHRSHAYQWLARRLGGHKPVTLTVVGLNLVWLLPLACLAELNPRWATWITLVALTPVVVLAIAAGAGRREGA